MCATTIERGGRNNILGGYDWNASHFIERNHTYNENDRNLYEDVRISYILALKEEGTYTMTHLQNS